MHHTSTRSKAPGSASSGIGPGPVAAVLPAVILSAILSALPAVAVNADHDGVVARVPAAGTPHVMNGSVNAITQVGDLVVAAGTFTRVSPADTFGSTRDDLVRNRIFAFDARTGEIDPDFDPNLNGEVTSLETDGRSVYVGGRFGAVGGSPAYKRLVRLDLSGRPLDDFDAVPSASVNDIVLRGRRLYVGGAFTSVRSRRVEHRRRALAVLDPELGTPLDAVALPFTGVYDPRKDRPGTTNVKKLDVTTDGDRLVAIGNFSAVDGTPRAQVAVLDTSGASAVLTPWTTDRFSRSRNSCAGAYDTFTRNVDFSPDGSWFVVTTTGAFAGGATSGTLCDTVSRWETESTANEPTWIDYTGGDTLSGVAVTGDVVYVGGHPRWFNNPFQGDQEGPGAIRRQGIAALDAANGLPLSWNPGRDRGVGAQALLATDSGLWVGSDTTRIAGEDRGRIAFLPLTGGRQLPADPAPATLPGSVYTARRGSTSAPGMLTRRELDGSGVPTGDATTVAATAPWSQVRGAFWLDGWLYYGSSDGLLRRRTFDPGTAQLGAPAVVNLRNDPESGRRIPFPVSAVSGMFYEGTTHRIYYTVAGDHRLYYRYFTAESRLVGAQTFRAGTGGVDLSDVAGMTLAGDRILYGSSDGALRSVPFTRGRVRGDPTVLSTDGTWRLRALFTAP